jgi:hypothetical protein
VDAVSRAQYSIDRLAECRVCDFFSWRHKKKKSYANFFTQKSVLLCVCEIVAEFNKLFASDVGADETATLDRILCERINFAGVPYDCVDLH